MLTKTDLVSIEKIVSTTVERKIKPLEKKITSIEKDVVYIRKSVGQIVKTFDKDYLELRSRVEQLEQHLGFPQN